MIKPYQTISITPSPRSTEKQGAAMAAKQIALKVWIFGVKHMSSVAPALLDYRSAGLFLIVTYRVLAPVAIISCCFTTNMAVCINLKLQTAVLLSFDSCKIY